MCKRNAPITAFVLFAAAMPDPSFADSTTPGSVYVDQIPGGIPATQSSGNANTAAVEQHAILGYDNAASIQQNGLGGTVNVTQQGQQNAAAIAQFGLGDKVSASQYGANLGVQINQYGNNSAIGVMQFGTGMSGAAPISIKQY